ncbi:glycosyltransferase family 39 protein [Nocardia sp. NPDC051750]|uniref:glycosyltransferase family 39 protein n=1 Tax=Nocardia sp. NPDC051750 TaxID=3364325 RepID=UPI0037BD18AD
MTDTVTAPDPGFGARTDPQRDTTGGHRRRDRWQWTGLALLLLGTAATYVWNLSANGWANPFYAAAVEAGATSWKALFFGSLDAANAITVDKTPVSLWPMELSVRLFGMNSWSMLLPQVLLGVASVALLWATVRRHFGPGAGLLAGLLLAVTPVAALMFRFNNPDALLVFLMLAAVWAMSRALTDGRWRWLLWCGLFVGLGFLAKQLQVLLVLPALALTYLIAGPPAFGKRIAQLFAAGAAMVAGAGWWLLIAQLWPADRRPYFGGSQHNSIIELTLGYNGLERLGGGDGPGPGPGGPGGPPPALPSGRGPFTDSGIGRLFSTAVGGQISWFIPAALILVIAALAVCGRSRRTEPRRAVLIMFGLWVLLTGIVFSFMKGIFHEYYTVALAPALAGTLAAALALLWPDRDRWWIRLSLIAAVVSTAVTAWTALSRTPDFLPWLRWAVAGAAVLGVAALAAGPRGKPAVVALVTVLVTGLAGPVAYTIETVLIPHTGSVPLAGPHTERWIPGPPGATGPGGPGPRTTTLPGGPMPAADATVVALLDRDADSYTWIAATVGSMQQGTYQLAADGQIMAIGGFAGGDPSPTLEQFQRYVADHAIHYFIAGDFGGVPGFTEGNEGAQITNWVTANFTSTDIAGITLYDLTAPK